MDDALDRLVADFDRTGGGDLYGSAQPANSKLAGAAVHGAGLVVGGFHGWHGIEQSLAGLGLGALLFGVLAVMGGMGMGDVKLCAAIGAWIGPSQLVVALVVTGIAGGVMALCWAAAGGFLGELFKNTGDLVVGIRSADFVPIRRWFSTIRYRARCHMLRRSRLERWFLFFLVREWNAHMESSLICPVSTKSPEEWQARGVSHP